MARVQFSSRVPPRWRVWYSGKQVIQICVGDRAIYETGAWEKPPVIDLSVMVGPRFPGTECLLDNMTIAGSA